MDNVAQHTDMCVIVCGCPTNAYICATLFDHFDRIFGDFHVEKPLENEAVGRAINDLSQVIIGTGKIKP